MSVLNNLKPERVFYYFEELCKIPHGSHNTKEISDFLVDFARKHDLSYTQDESNNVIIHKHASPGYENAPVTIIQGHCDMVCEKKPGSAHDFFKDPLDLRIEGDFIWANDTTLGGDDGIAVAYALAILEDNAAVHPALEVIITTDEEVGLLGAAALDASMLKGTYMLNLDSGEEGKILTGCAGGMTAKSCLPLTRIEEEGMLITVNIGGLLGGHSGVDILKKRANANILMGRFLFELAKHVDYALSDIEGGQKDNAIPRLCTAQIVTDGEQAADIKAYAEVFQKNLRTEYSGSDEGITVETEEKNTGCHKTLDAASKAKIIFYLMNIPCGIQKMSGLIDNLVETSTNLGILKIDDDVMIASSSSRSSVSSAKMAVGDKIRFLTEFLGGEYTEEGAYPAWEYKADSRLRELAVSCHEKLYGKKPAVEVIHAGLECGLFFGKIKNLDCISFGPDLYNIHTTEEKMSISSVEYTYNYLLEILKNIE